MFLLPGHGTTAVSAKKVKNGYSGRIASDFGACGFMDEAEMPAAPELGSFGYFFGKASNAPREDGVAGTLDELADAMVREPADLDENSEIPPVFTYFGQFIDHDLTANTDREGSVFVIDEPEVTPLARDFVSDNLKNLRASALNLDSVHGGGPLLGPFAQKLAQALRFPDDMAKLWVGQVTATGFDDIRPPHDPARDLLRLHDLLRRGVVTEAELNGLGPDVRKPFFNPATDEVNLQRAILGDGRNDENLAVAQFHLIWVRLHNVIVQHVRDNRVEFPNAPTDHDGLFDWARLRTSWVYQWLVIHSYLATICNDATLREVVAQKAPVYTAFLADHPAPARAELLPMPLEFSAAAFRFGHSMVRDSYDWNRQFGRTDTGAPLLPAAPFELLFQFTGNGDKPMDVPVIGSTISLPDHWPIEWDRFVFAPTEEMPDRAARKIDTNLAIPLGNMVNEEAGGHGVLRHLARRNLRRGHRLNLPSAQGCLAELARVHGVTLPQLSRTQLVSGPTGEAVENGNFVDATPLWFYVLKEAEILGHGECLGPLGSRIVAETIVGLIANDPDSYWNAADGGASWTPGSEFQPGGTDITDMPSLMRAAGVMD